MEYLSNLSKSDKGIAPNEGEKVYTVTEVANLLGMTRQGVLWLINAGDIKAFKATKKTSQVWNIPASSLEAFIAKPEGNDYEAFYRQFVEALSYGHLSQRPGYKLAPKTISYYMEGIKRLWRYSKVTPSVEAIGFETIRLALLAVPIERGKRKCHYSLRDSIYRGARVFCKYKLQQGLMTLEEYKSLSDLKPKAVFEADTKAMSKVKAEWLIEMTWENGHNDGPVTAMCLALMLYCGLRREEVVNLLLEDVRLTSKPPVIRVYGKGGKHRLLGIPKKLQRLMVLYLQERLKQSGPKSFILSSVGRQLTADNLKCRIERLKRRHKVDFSAHQLRYTFATQLMINGYSLSEIQYCLGHSDPTITARYLKMDPMKIAKKMVL